ncbi:MAG TPA: ribonuclease P protein component [Pirellula sp.]|nr:ribonuclease P protein component [Pirellula sp.]
MTHNDERFPKSVRLVSQLDFDRAFHEGVVASDSVLVIYAVRGKLAWTRIGLSVSKRVGNSPIRNRWKRLIREAFRRQKAVLPIGIDMVIRPKRGATPDYECVFSSLRKLAMQLERKLNAEDLSNK